MPFAATPAQRALLLPFPRHPRFEDQCGMRVKGSNTGVGQSTDGHTWTNNSNTGWSTNGRSLKCSAGAGNTRRMWMSDLKIGFTDVLVAWSLNLTASGGTYNVMITGHQLNIDNDMVYARVDINTDNTMDLSMNKRVAASDTGLGSAAEAVNVATFSANAIFLVRLQVQNVGVNVLGRGKIWPITGTEPTAWQSEGVDSNATVSQNGAVGWRFFVHASGATTIATIYKVLEYRPGLVIPRYLV